MSTCKLPISTTTTKFIALHLGKRQPFPFTMKFIIGTIPKKYKIKVLGTKIHSYELKIHPHIEEDKAKQVCFLKKINLIKFFFNRGSGFCHYNGAPL